jgi:hypothetical protein
MLGQGLAFVPNYSIAKMAAGRMFRLIDRKPQIYSPQIIGSSDLVSGIFSKYDNRGFSVDNNTWLVVLSKFMKCILKIIGFWHNIECWLFT